jgi:hypothetical protein
MIASELLCAVCLVSQGGVIGFVTGSCVSAVGAIVFMHSRSAHLALEEFKAANSNLKEVEIQRKFMELDSSGMSQFA